MAIGILACALAASASGISAQTAPASAKPLYQLRIYALIEASKPAFHARFRDHAMRIMRRHGFDIVATWEAEEAGQPQLAYLLKWRDEAAMKAAWAAYMTDPEWVRIKAETPADPPIMDRILTDKVLHLTDYSPGAP